MFTFIIIILLLNLFYVISESCVEIKTHKKQEKSFIFSSMLKNEIQFSCPETFAYKDISYDQFDETI